MRYFLITVAVTMTFAATLQAAEEQRTDFDWNAWRNVPVQNGGRPKPLDTLAWETLRVISNQVSLTDPETNERLDATAAYLSMLFDWQGWDSKERDRLLTVDDWSSHYYELHNPDPWDEAPLLRVDYLKLRSMLGLEQDQKYVAPADLSKTVVVDPQNGQKILFATWGNRLLELDEKEAALTELEKKGLELANRLWTYQSLRMGRGLEILPIKGNAEEKWTPIAAFMLTHYDDATDTSGQYRQVQKLLLQARAAYKKHDAATFNAIAGELKPILRNLGEDLGEYPGASVINYEVAYNHWAPFRFAWVLMLTAALCMLLNLGTQWKLFSVGAWAAYGCGLAAMVAGFWLRMAISGRPPVTNMYESVIFVGFVVAGLGLIFEGIFRGKFILTAAAIVSTVAMVLADNGSVILDPSVRPLQPVLRSNFWLTLHVLTITSSYGVFALAMGVANITLGYFLVGSSRGSAISFLNRITYRIIQVGVLLLAAGTILGGVWADYAWGRFWGWDPKEVWALIALLGYLCVLHARFAGWVGQRGLPAVTVACFALVVMAWYGVNFVLGAGLHSYGFGGGGQGWVYGAVLLELLYTGVALLRTCLSTPRFAPSLAQTPQILQARLSAPSPEDAQIVENIQMAEAIRSAEKVMPS